MVRRNQRRMVFIAGNTSGWLVVLILVFLDSTHSRGIGVPVDSDDDDQIYSNKDLESLISDLMVPSLAG